MTKYAENLQEALMQGNCIAVSKWMDAIAAASCVDDEPAKAKEAVRYASILADSLRVIADGIENAAADLDDSWRE